MPGSLRLRCPADLADLAGWLGLLGRLALLARLARLEECGNSHTLDALKRSADLLREHLGQHHQAVFPVVLPETVVWFF